MSVAATLGDELAPTALQELSTLMDAEMISDAELQACFIEMELSATARLLAR